VNSPRPEPGSTLYSPGTERTCGDETYDKIDEAPEQLRKRTLGVRTFDRHSMMLGFELADGRELEPAIDKLFANADAEYLVHFAAPGCYAARVERA
jgi:hypothetical protein